MADVKLNKKKQFIAPKDVEITNELVNDAIDLHRANLLDHYIENEDMYMSDHEILHRPYKENYKPDNRLVINYAKYIVDSFDGYHLGIPLKVSHEDENVDTFVDDFRHANGMNDTEYEVGKMTDIFGHAFLYVYQDEDGQTKVHYLSPVNMFMVYDDSIQGKPKFAVRYAIDDMGQIYGGEAITEDEIISLTSSGQQVSLGDRQVHIYDGLPVIEVVGNEERQGIFDPVKTLINELNKAMSEKANDVDYFADAYLHIDGMEMVDEEGEQIDIRDNRTINTFDVSGQGKPVTVQFLEKPNADTTQENLIAHLKETIFNVSMVANLNDENFGTASGTAMAFKLQNMSNMAKAKDRKMEFALNRMYELVFSVPKASVPEDAWEGLEYTFTRNVPRNLLEETQVMNNLDGHVSNETKLKALSIVENPQNELDKIQDERQAQTDLSRRIEQRSRMTDENLFGERVMEEPNEEGEA